MKTRHDLLMLQNTPCHHKGGIKMDCLLCTVAVCLALIALAKLDAKEQLK